MEFNLGDYKPEAIKENDFEMMKGKGNICKVNSSIIEQVDGGVSTYDQKPYEAHTRLSYELEVTEGKYAKRKVWKKYNISSTATTGKVPKTGLQKLADLFFTLGLEFTDAPSLDKANEKFVELELVVSFSSFTPKGNTEPIQLHTVTGINTGETVASQPTTSTGGF